MTQQRLKARPATAQDPRWAALIARDAAADGTFFYAVRTTGVYCRPSCASRRAKPENVSFYSDCDAAERAGFRPCKRCQPRQASLEERRASTVARICELIRHSEQTLPLSD